MTVARNLALRQLGARLGRSVIVLITEKPQVLKVVDNIGTESVEGFWCERCEKPAVLFGQHFRSCCH